MIGSTPLQTSTDSLSRIVFTHFSDPEYVTPNVVEPPFLSFEHSNFRQIYEGFHPGGRWSRLQPDNSISDTLPPAIAANWSRLALSGIGTALYTRLVNLAKREAGWRGSGSRALDGSSLQTFLNFWKMVRGYAVQPQVVLAPNGNMQAIWQKSSKKILDLEFAEGNRVYFGLFDGASVQDGVDAANELARALLNRSSEPLKWR